MNPTKLDLTGLKCPLPALMTAKALKTLTPGAVLEVHCTDPLSVIDIPHLVRQTGDKVEITERTEQRIIFLIEKTNRPIEDVRCVVAGWLTARSRQLIAPVWRQKRLSNATISTFCLSTQRRASAPIIGRTCRAERVQREIVQSTKGRLGTPPENLGIRVRETQTCPAKGSCRED